MALPEFDANGSLPPGLHAASFAEVAARFGGSETRQKQLDLLRDVLQAALSYPTIKRILLWGSFVTQKPEPNDLDYSLVVSVDYAEESITPKDSRFLTPLGARIYYGVDKNYLLIKDYPFEKYAEYMLFLGGNRRSQPVGIIEIYPCCEAEGETL